MPKNLKFINKIILFAMMLFCFAGCENAPQVNKDEITVCLIEGNHFIARSYVNKAERGDDVTFRFTLLEGYEIEGCSYDNCTITQEGDAGTIVLHDVRYPCRVSVNCILPLTVITYDYNGGAAGIEESETVTYKKTAHPRINTSIASGVFREGYCLTGWNTQADGLGEHIGLGSRITAEDQAELTLYAQWELENPSTDFLFEESDTEVRLVKYIGADEKKLVIPTFVDGKKVTYIGSGFACDIDFDVLVLPDTIKQIEEGAFGNCDIRELYFFDNILNVSDKSFSEKMPHTWHINARLEPRYIALNDITVFADKMDLLMLNADKPKMILFAGCSMFYGLNSEIIAEEYSDYTILNMGAVGGTNASFQLDCITKYINEGDVFIHAPEEASAYQLLGDVTCENRVFIATEGNFDLLTMTDMSKMQGSFDCFNAFNYNRRKMEVSSYEDSFSFNEYGDNTTSRERLGEDKQFKEDYGIYDNLITEESLNTLCDYYDAIKEKGAKVFVSFAPINRLCVDNEAADRFEQKLTDGLFARGYQVISKIKDYIMEPSYFYDTDYHLTSEGAQIRTENLLRDLKLFLELKISKS